MYELKIVHTKFNYKESLIILFYFLNYEKGSFEVELLNTHYGER